MMRHRKKRLWPAVLALALALSLPVLRQVCLPLAREAFFDYTAHTDAEEAVMAFARQEAIPYSSWPENLIGLLDRNPETEDFVLSYPRREELDLTVDLSAEMAAGGVPLLMQWDKRWGYLDYGKDLAALTGCGPVCLSMAALYLTGDPAMSPDNMIRFALEEGYSSRSGGSKWTLISEGADKLGLTATELPLVKSLIFSHLEAGDPVICVMGPGDFTTTGHFILLRGVEEGQLLVNDPNSRERSAQRWDYDRISGQIRNLWALQRP